MAPGSYPRTMSSAAPGWYPVEGDDRLRWWDGQAWTENFQDQAGSSAAGTAVREAGSARAGTRSFPEDAIWSAVGKSVTGMGAGRYWLTPLHLFFDKGAQRGPSRQVPVADVTGVDVKQSMTQKARGVFTVSVHLNQGGRVEMVSMDDIPDGRMAQAIINATAHEARLAIQRQQDTPTHPSSGPVPAPAQAEVQPSTQAPAAPDPMELLRKVEELRDAGILSDDEFAEKKAAILSRL